MTHGVTLFRIAGIPVRIHASWLVIFGLIAWSLSVGYFPHVLPGVPAAAYWVQGLAAALLLFVSVFLHELSHSVVARAHGLPVSAITLHVFGGVSELQREPESPRVEFWMAVAGPLTSFALAAVAAGGAAATTGVPAVAAILRYLATVNLVVGAFNLVPGFPLDGGRILRAALWKARGDLGWATRVASRAGTIVAFLLMGLGAFRALTGEFLGGLWLVLIGSFLRQAAEGSYQQLVMRRALAPFRVRDVMASTVVSIPPDRTLAEVVDETLLRHHVSSFPVVAGGRVLGVLGLQQLRRVPRERWAETAVRDVMLPMGPALVVAPGDRLADALDKLAQNGLGRAAVIEDGTLAGYLSLRDVFHVLAISDPGVASLKAPGP